MAQSAISLHFFHRTAPVERHRNKSISILRPPALATRLVEFPLVEIPTATSPSLPKASHLTGKHEIESIVISNCGESRRVRVVTPTPAEPVGSFR